jgi:ribosome maturation factor RimP
MDRQEIITELKNIIGEYLRVQGLDLVDLIYRYEGQGLTLRVLTDRPCGGINLKECSHLNYEISRILDEKGILETRYILEISSPGLDRPLKTKSDFERCINRKARFFLSEPINSKIELEGIITKVENNAVYIDIEGEATQIPLIKLTKAKQIIDII